MIAGWIAREVGAGARAPLRRLRAPVPRAPDVHVYVRALQQRGVPVLGRARGRSREGAGAAAAPGAAARAREPGRRARGARRAALAARRACPTPSSRASRREFGGRWRVRAPVAIRTPPPETLPNLARAFAPAARAGTRARRASLSPTCWPRCATRRRLLALHASRARRPAARCSTSPLCSTAWSRARAAGPERGLGRAGARRSRARSSAARPRSRCPTPTRARCSRSTARRGSSSRRSLLPDLARGGPPSFGDAWGVEARFSREQGALARAHARRALVELARVRAASSRSTSRRRAAAGCSTWPARARASGWCSSTAYAPRQRSGHLRALLGELVSDP